MPYLPTAIGREHINVFITNFVHYIFTTPLRGASRMCPAAKRHLLLRRVRFALRCGILGELLFTYPKGAPRARSKSLSWPN